MNLNSEEYWNHRFGSGDWTAKSGHSQTEAFARAQIERFGLTRDFDGTLCDFGCGAGDAFPVYREAFPRASLFGVDFSKDAIALCRRNFSEIAQFACGDTGVVPECDVVVCSNVLEHVEDDTDIVASLLTRCYRLYVVVPFRESPLSEEHIRSYDRTNFAMFAPKRIEVFDSPGWTEYGWRELIKIYGLNPLRALTGRRIRRRRMQVLFEIVGQRKPN